MKVFVMNKKRVIFALCFIIVIIATAVSVAYCENTSVFKNTNSLPIYCVDNNKKQIAISFDAGWGNEDTEKLIEILGENGVVDLILTKDWYSIFASINRARAELDCIAIRYLNYKAAIEKPQLIDVEYQSQLASATVNAEFNKIRADFVETAKAFDSKRQDIETKHSDKSNITPSIVIPKFTIIEVDAFKPLHTKLDTTASAVSTAEAVNDDKQNIMPFVDLQIAAEANDVVDSAPSFVNLEGNRLQTLQATSTPSTPKSTPSRASTLQRVLMTPSRLQK